MRVAVMSVIDSVVDETNFRFILFLVSQIVAVAALVAIALRSAIGTSARNFLNNR